MQAFGRVLDAATEVAALLSTICVGLTALAYVSEIVARYALNAPLNWSSDFGSYMLCASVFLGIPKVTAEREHPSISFSVDRLSKPAQIRYGRVLAIITGIVVACICAFVARELIQQYNTDVLTSMANQIPRWWLTATASVGLVLSALQFLYPRPALTQDQEGSR